MGLPPERPLRPVGGPVPELSVLHGKSTRRRRLTTHPARRAQTQGPAGDRQHPGGPGSEPGARPCAGRAGLPRPLRGQQRSPSDRCGRGSASGALQRRGGPGSAPCPVPAQCREGHGLTRRTGGHGLEGELAAGRGRGRAGAGASSAPCGPHPPALGSACRPGWRRPCLSARVTLWVSLGVRLPAMCSFCVNL